MYIKLYKYETITFWTDQADYHIYNIKLNLVYLKSIFC